MSTTTLHISANGESPEEAVEKKQDIPEKKVKKPFNIANIIPMINQYFAKMTPIKAEDKVSFFRLLATMINAGISLTKGLKILQDQVKNPHFKQIVADVAEQIENGISFSEALAVHNKYFNEAQIGMVESGEATGRLNQTLLQIATETEKSAQLTKKIKGAMIYPATILIILAGALYAVMTLVIPKIKDVFSSLGSDLPTSTKALISMSDFMTTSTASIPNSIWLLIAIGLFILVLTWWKKTRIGKILWAKFLMRLPVFGDLIKKAALARFCRSLSTLTSSGVSILKTLSITASSVDNPVYSKRIKMIAEDVKQGIPMGESMKGDPYFSAMVVGMINVAEQTAQIDDITGKLADFFEEELDDMIKNLSRLIEPIIIVVLGGAIGFLVISIMTPILQSSDLAFGEA